MVWFAATPDADPSEQRSIVTTRPTPDLLSGKSIFRIGLGLVILAAVMFFRYSVEQGWIEPPVRVALAGLAGIAMIVTGLNVTERRPAYGTLLQGGGSAVLYLTAFAAHHRYQLIDPTSGFIGLVAVSSLVVLLAVRQRSQALAIVGVVGALAAPSLIDGRMLVFAGDAAYVAVVAAFGVFLFVRMVWLQLYLATVIGITTATTIEGLRAVLDRYGLITVAQPASGAELTVDAVTLLVALWLIPSAFSAFRSSRDLELGATIGTLLAPITGAAVLLMAWTGTIGDTGLMAVAVGIGILAGAVGLALRTLRPALAQAQIIPFLVLLLVGWFAGIDSPAILALIVTAQATGMIVAGIRRRLVALTVAGQALLGLTGTAWLVLVLENADRTFDVADAATGSMLMLVTFAGIEQRRSTTPATSAAGEVSLWLAGAGAVGWAFAALHLLPNGPGLVTAAWATIGAGLVVVGRLVRTAATRNAGMGLVLAAVGKLLLVDTVGVSGLVRMGLFAGIGLGLLVLGYWLGDDPEPETAELAPGSIGAAPD